MVKVVCNLLTYCILIDSFKYYQILAAISDVERDLALL